MNVPKLRFKEFTGEWKQEKLKASSYVYDGTHETPKYISSGIKFISVENINDFYKSEKYISIDDYNKYKIKPQSNDIFMTRIGDIGTSNIYDGREPLAYYVSLALIRTKLNPNYLNQYIKSNNFQRELYNRTIHVAFPKKINTGEIADCKIYRCSINEQTKIATFLSLLDKKIELQSKKIEALKLYKKGLILSLKKNDSNWNKYKISDIFKITRGTVIPKTELSEEMDNIYRYPVYSSQTSNNGILGYDKKYDFDGEYLTWTTDGANAGKVFYRNGKFRCTNVCGILYENNTLFTNELVSELLNYETPKYVSYVGNPKLMNNAMADITLKLPNKDTQKNISHLISKINYKINLEYNKLNNLHQLKKGLMQNMFV